MSAVLSTSKDTKTIAASEAVAVAQITSFGTKLTVPENMTIDQAIKLLQRRKVYDEEAVAVDRTFDAFPWDGAVALNEVLKSRYGWAPAEATMGFFGPEPPQLRAVEIGYKQTVQIPWGRFRIPGVEADLFSAIGEKRGRKLFRMVTEVRRKWEGEVKRLYDEVERYLEEHSIYRGKAIRLDFSKLAAEKIVEPSFMDVANTDPDGCVFSQSVKDAVDTNVYTPILRYAELKRFGIHFKRGVLFVGKFGVGKTLAMGVAAHYAEREHITFIHCPEASQLAQAVDFARMYQPAVIACEDIDRTLAGERTASMDQVLNIIDGVESKNTEIMIVCTTNDAEALNPAVVRPGRLDAVIHVTPPDGPAVQQLLRMFGRDVIPVDEDLTLVGERLAGHIPAIIEEVVKRSKLAALKRAVKGTHAVSVDAVALLESADTMQMQLDLLYNRPEGERLPTIDRALREVFITSAREMAVDGEPLLADKTYKFTTPGSSNIKLLAEGSAK